MYKGKYPYYKKCETDKVFWVDNYDYVGIHLFSFDKKTVYNLFRDYPWALTEEEKKIFDDENPYWANFFKARSK